MTPGTPTSSRETASPIPKNVRQPPISAEYLAYNDVWPNLDELVTEDGAPVDNFHHERNMRLLTEPLYASWPGPPGENRTFVACANVGLFYEGKMPPLVPDVMLAIDVPVLGPETKEGRSYFVWIRGKVPDVVIEIISGIEGSEETTKMATYARWGIPYYVIFDPDRCLHGDSLRIYELAGKTYRRRESDWLDSVGLGLKEWKGTYEGLTGSFLRWCTRDGELIPTGEEAAATARAALVAEQHRATFEFQRAEAERERAERALQELARLRERLGREGVEP